MEAAQRAASATFITSINLGPIPRSSVYIQDWRDGKIGEKDLPEEV